MLDGFQFIEACFMFGLFPVQHAEPTRLSSLPNATLISPEQLSYDFSKLRNLLTSTLGSVAFVAGPDISARPLRKKTERSVSHEIKYLRR